MWRRDFLYCSVIFIVGCNFQSVVNYPDKNNFYDRDLYEDDVIRLPFKYPYELISAAGVNQLMIDGNSALEKKYHISGVINSIYVSDEIILLHGNFNMVGDRKYCLLTKDTS